MAHRKEVTMYEKELVGKLNSLKTYLTAKKEKAVNKQDIEFLEGILFCVEEINERIVRLEKEALPDQSFITDHDVPHRIR